MRYLLLCSCLALAACASTPTERNDVLMDSGLPLSELKQDYNVLHYHLLTDVLVEEQAIDAVATVRVEAVDDMDTLELDFDGQFTISSVSSQGPLTWSSSPSTLRIALPQPLDAGEIMEVQIAYSGKPVVASRPPWNGGFVWAESPSGKPWMATAFQGEGCDVWFPCKDHPSGEPRDGVDLVFIVPEDTIVASNGVLVSDERLGDGRRQFHWRTTSTINTYGIAFNAGPYVLIESTYTSTNGTEVPVMFWALEEREAQARKLFDEEFQPIIDWFEQVVGPYPWGHEKLGVVETPHLGMEHQTINAYGNEYRRDQFGFDWLFHHELAHEWFGNVMTHRTVSDMWLHEGFGAYMQSLYTLDTLGDAAFRARMYGSLRQIQACVPFAPREETSDDQLYFEDNGGPGPDIYAKASWVIHTLRMHLGDEVFWRAVRRLVYGTAEPETLAAPIQARFRDTDDFLRIVNEESGADYAWFFEAYFRRGPLPELDIEQDGDDVRLTWRAADELPFPMPLPVRVDGELRTIGFDGNSALIEQAHIDDIKVDPHLDVLRHLSPMQTCAERKADDV